MPPKASSGAKRAPSRGTHFKWTPSYITQLLQLIKDNPEYRAALFQTGLVQRVQYVAARELLLELVKDAPDYLAILRQKRLIERDGRGHWRPLDAWNSTIITNPVITKMGALRTKYETATREHDIRPEWTRFADLPARIRGDFRATYPWFFKYKELAMPALPFQPPPLHLQIFQPPAPAPAAPAPALPRPVVKARHRAPPSPPPSDRSSSSSSPSPSPSPSPPPPPPRPVASSSAAFLTPRPNTVPPRPNPITVLSSGPRPHARPDAVASSSRVPIKVEYISSSSSASSESDRQMDSDSEPDTDSDSEHEMENDLGEMKSTRGSLVPQRRASPSTTMLAVKRAHEEVPLSDAKRHKPHARPTPKREPIESASTVSYKQPPSAPSSLLELDALASVLEHSRPPAPILSPSSASTDSLEDAADESDEASGSEQGHSLEVNAANRYADETITEKRNRLMNMWRDAVGPEVMDATTLLTIPEYLDRIRGEYAAAQSDDARLEIIRRHRKRLFHTAVYQLRKNDLLPKCLSDCRLRKQCGTKSERKTFKNLMRHSGADEKGLLEGPQPSFRIQIRTDMQGYEFEDIIIPKGSRTNPYDTRIRECSIMAFARFWYRSVCAALKNSHRQHLSALIPAPAPAAPSAAPALERPSMPSDNGRANHQATKGNGDDLFAVFDKESETKPILMARLRSAIKPRQVTATILGANTYDRLLLLHFAQAVDQKEKRTIIEGAQLSISLLVLYRLEKNNFLPVCLEDCQIWVRITEDSTHKKLRGSCRVAGAVLCHSNADLVTGPSDVIRYEIRDSLPGWTVRHVTVLAETGENIGKRIRVRQCSYLGFVRFFHDRILETAGR